MELLNYIFQLGVLFAIFGFIWGVFDFGLRLLTQARPRRMAEDYFLKLLKYLFLSDVTFLFSYEKANQTAFSYNVLIAGLILLTYFIGKLQRQQNQLAFIKIMNQGQLNTPHSFNLRNEIIMIILACGLFTFFLFYPQTSSNPISLWLHDAIQNIEDTPIFGLFFKVIGFFFLISLIFKFLNFAFVLLTGNPLVQTRGFQSNQRQDQENNDFDDFEELN